MISDFIYEENKETYKSIVPYMRNKWRVDKIQSSRLSYQVKVIIL